MNSRPLDDIRVVDLSRFIAGPFCTQILGDMGADVVKIEKHGGEDARQNPPLVDSVSLYALSLNRNKRSMTLDTRHPSAKDILRRLLRRADVLVENFRPGTLARMGLDYEALHTINPRLIVTSLSGFGQTGPLAHRALFDCIAQAMSGLMSLTGGDLPTLSGTYIADYVTGLYGAIGTLLALRHRDRTGQGQIVDIASIDSLFSCLATQVTASIALDRVPRRMGARDELTAPANVFRSLDGDLYIHGGTNALFPRLCTAIGRPDLAEDPRFATIDGRMAFADELEEAIQSWAAKKSLGEVGDKLTAQGIPWGPVLTLPEVAESEFIRSRNMLLSMDHPKLGKVTVPGSPLKLSESGPSLNRPAPDAGQHTREILMALGYSTTEISKLQGSCAV